MSVSKKRLGFATGQLVLHLRFRPRSKNCMKVCDCSMQCLKTTTDLEKSNVWFLYLLRLLGCIHFACMAADLPKTSHMERMRVLSPTFIGHTLIA